MPDDHASDFSKRKKKVIDTFSANPIRLLYKFNSVEPIVYLIVALCIA